MKQEVYYIETMATYSTQGSIYTFYKGLGSTNLVSLSRLPPDPSGDSRPPNQYSKSREKEPFSAFSKRPSAL